MADGRPMTTWFLPGTDEPGVYDRVRIWTDEGDHWNHITRELEPGYWKPFVFYIEPVKETDPVDER
jgi:hypothetical protein